MKFFAFIKPKSMLEKRWRASSINAGIFMGIHFRWVEEAQRYESMALTAEQITHINSKPPDAVIMETVQKLPPLLISQ